MFWWLFLGPKTAYLEEVELPFAVRQKSLYLNGLFGN